MERWELVWLSIAIEAADVVKLIPLGPEFLLKLILYVLEVVSFGCWEWTEF